MNMNIMTIIIIIIILIILYQLIQKNSKSGDTDIYQINNFNKNIYKKYLNLNRPIIITNYLTDFPSFETLCFDVIKNFNIKIAIKLKNKLFFRENKIENLQNYINNINTTNYVIYNNNSYFRNYTFEKLIDNYKSLTLTDNPKYFLNIFPSNFKTPITKNNDNKLFFLIYDGYVLINLLNPNNINNEKLNDIKSIKLDHYKVLLKNNLKLEETAIVCRPGKIIIIPNNWWYYIESKKPSIIVKLY